MTRCRSAIVLLAMIVVLTDVTNAAPVTITFFGSGGTAIHNKYLQLIASFEAANPDVKVNVQWDTSGVAQQAYQKVAVLTASGAAPDVYWLHSYTLLDLIQNGLLTQLDSQVASDSGKLFDRYYPASFNDYKYNGSVWGIPREITTVALYYNKDMFSNRGVANPVNWAWTDLVSQARKLTYESNQGKVYGLFAPTTHGYDLTAVWQNEGDIVSADRSQATFSSPNTIEAYKWITNLMYKDGVAPAPGDVPAWNLNLFSNQRTAMLYHIPSYSLRLPAAGFDWDIAELPKGKQQATRTASSGHGIHSATRHLEASWRLLRHLSTIEANEVFADGVSIPPIAQVATSKAFLKQDGKNFRVFLDGLRYARSEPVSTRWQEVIGLKNKALTEVWNGNRSVEEALLMLDTQVNALLSEKK